MRRIPDAYYALPDIVLLDLARGGDPAAAAALIDRHGDMFAACAGGLQSSAASWADLLTGVAYITSTADESAASG